MKAKANPIDPAQWVRVENFLADYAHRLDDGRIDDWTGFFTAEATYQITTRENHEAGYPIGIMLCKGKGMMEDRVLALKTANVFEPHTYCHIVGRPDLRETAAGEYTARSNFIVYRTMEDGDAKLFATGKYLDRIVMEGEEPKFAERIVILDSRCVDVLLVFPL
ncbi:MAG: aromatic-ring-hydroxylating dioxygenase subunit beta [Betaproteobacteria bacterium]